MRLMRALVALEDVPVRPRAEAHSCKRLVGSRMKGEATIDRSELQVQRRILAQILVDADLLLGIGSADTSQTGRGKRRAVGDS